MRTTFIVAAAIAAAANSAIASETNEVMAPIYQFVDGVNKGDMKSAGAVYAADASIIDEFGQHHWAGANAFGDWSNAFTADMKANGITDPWMKLSKPSLVRINTDHAYVVQSGLYTFKLNGKPQSENGLFTYALDKTASGWRIASWSWATQ